MVEKGYTKPAKVARWLLYGVVLSCIPFLVAAGYEWYIGYDFTLFKVDYVPGFVTITFSVAANACGYATDEERIFSSAWKKVFSIISLVSLGICLLFYSWLLSSEETTIAGNENYTEDTIITEVVEEKSLGRADIRADRSIVIAKITAVALVGNIIMGVVLECGAKDRQSSNVQQ